MTAADPSSRSLPAAGLDRRAVGSWRRFWPWLAAPLSGALLVLSLAPWEQEWLCWIALAPLIAAVWFAPVPAPALSTPDARASRLRRSLARLAHWRRQRWLRCFLFGYLCGLVYIWGAFYWLTTVTVPGWIILGPYMACYPALWCVFIGTLASPGPGSAAVSRPHVRPSGGGGLFIWNPAPASESPLLRSRWNLWFAFLAASAWVGLEWVRGWLFSGWGWNDLGVALHGNLPFIQIAEYTGVGGLSFVAAFVNVIAVATVGRFILEVRAHRVRPHFDFTLTVAGLMILFSSGVRTLQRSHAELTHVGATVPLRVAAVQANIAHDDNPDPDRAERIIKTYEDLTATALATHPQLLLWPEAATPYSVYEISRRTLNSTYQVAETGGCNFLFGTVDLDFGPDDKVESEYNAAMMVVPGSKHLQIYRKIHLVPYGEYVPYRHEFPPFAWIVGDQVPGDFGFGTEPKVFETINPAVRIAPLICFEDTLGELTRQPVLNGGKDGAQLLVNITNDAWFLLTAASRQHLNEAVFRTVENRRPLVRCANTGVTCFVDRDGRITPQTILLPDGGTVFGQGILSGVVDVPANPTLTFYTRHGDVFSMACASAAGLAVLLSGWRRLRRLEIRRRGGRPVVELKEATP